MCTFIKRLVGWDDTSRPNRPDRVHVYDTSDWSLESTFEGNEVSEIAWTPDGEVIEIDEWLEGGA